MTRIAHEGHSLPIYTAVCDFNTHCIPTCLQELKSPFTDMQVTINYSDWPNYRKLLFEFYVNHTAVTNCEYLPRGSKHVWGDAMACVNVHCNRHWNGQVTPRLKHIALLKQWQLSLENNWKKHIYGRSEYTLLSNLKPSLSKIGWPNYRATYWQFLACMIFSRHLSILTLKFLTAENTQHAFIPSCPVLSDFNTTEEGCENVSQI